MAINSFRIYHPCPKHCPDLRGLRHVSPPFYFIWLICPKHCPDLRWLRLAYLNKIFSAMRTGPKHCPDLRGLRRNKTPLMGEEDSGVRNIAPTWGDWDHRCFSVENRQDYVSETLPRLEGIETRFSLNSSMQCIYSPKHCPDLRGLRRPIWFP